MLVHLRNSRYCKLFKKKATVVNLHRLQKDQAKRVVDFLSGVIYAIEGDIQRIGPKIFLCTPRNISVAGTIDLDEDEKKIKSMVSYFFFFKLGLNIFKGKKSL